MTFYDHALDSMWIFLKMNEASIFLMLVGSLESFL